MRMDITTSKLLELPRLTPELQVSIKRLWEAADEDWLAAILYGRASQWMGGHDHVRVTPVQSG